MAEANIQHIHNLTGARAMKYEEPARSSPCEILRACVKENQKGDPTDHWAKERANYLHRGGLSEGVTNSIVESGGSAVEAIRWTQQWALEQVNLSVVSRLRYGSVRPFTLPI